MGEMDFQDVIYMEETEPGGMGNAAGVVLEVLDVDGVVRYETSIFSDEGTANAVMAKLKENRDQFDYYYGGAGNYVYLRKSARIVVDKQNDRFILEHQGMQYPFSSSVPGVFKQVAASLGRANRA